MSGTDLDTDVVTTPEMTNRAAQLVPKHVGSLTGFALSILATVVVGLFSSWFTMDRAREVNGPVAAGIMVVSSLIIAGFAWYQARIVTDVGHPQKYSFYKGMIAAGGIAAAMSAVALIGTVIYRDQSGGLNINGEESMMILAVLMAIFVLAEIVAVRNLGGSILRKQKPAED